MKHNLLFILLLVSMNTAAQTDTLRRTHLIGVGNTEVWDTYLSPEKYSGTSFRYTYALEKPVSIFKKWQTKLGVDVLYANTANRSEAANDLTGMLSAHFFWRYKLPLRVPGLTVQAGGGPLLNLGFIYNTRNGNNPAQGKADLNLAGNIQADYRFRLFKRPFAVVYEADMPLLGLMFTPQYGQAYYEIFNRGNYDHNVVITSPFSGASFRHRLSLDFPLFRTVFRIGYLGEYRQAEANHLKYHAYTHALMVGWVQYFSLHNYRP